MPRSAARARVVSGCLAVLATGSGTVALAAPAVWAPPGVRVSLSAPDSVRRGEPAHLGAVVSVPATGRRAPGVTVILYGRGAGGGGWEEAARAVTDARGLAAFRTTPRRTTDYAAETLPNSWFDGGTSGVVRVRVRG